MTLDEMIDGWNDFLHGERAFIRDRVAIMAPPDRTTTVKAGWAAVRDGWYRDSIDGKLLVIHDLGVVPPILFEQVRYGDVWVIEAEGVVVERLDMVPAGR